MKLGDAQRCMEGTVRDVGHVGNLDFWGHGWKPGRKARGDIPGVCLV